MQEDQDRFFSTTNGDSMLVTYQDILPERLYSKEGIGSVLKVRRGEWRAIECKGKEGTLGTFHFDTPSRTQGLSI